MAVGVRSSLLLGASLRKHPSVGGRRLFRISPWASISSGNAHMQKPPDETTAAAPEWRKKQLDRLEQRFGGGGGSSSSVLPHLDIRSDDELQPMWQELERKVKNRRSLTAEQNKGRTGRTNVRQTDEDLWLQEGLYDDDANKEETGGSK